MIGGILAKPGNVLANAGHLFLLFFAYKIGDPAVWAGALVLVAAISLYGWLYSYQRGRAISDLAPSRIASAAQGYVELGGNASSDPQEMVRSPLSGRLCVWFRCSVYEKHDNDKRLVSRQVSDQTITLRDATGDCQVDPDGAEIMGADSRVTREGNTEQVEEWIAGGSPLYVLGEFSTIGGAASVLDTKQDVMELLAEWKKDKNTLMQRFDLDHNGELDMHEWELARRQAVREVVQQHSEIRLQTGVNVVRAPVDGRLYLITPLSPHSLRRHFGWWSIFHLTVVFAALLIGLQIMQRYQLRLPL